MTTGGWVSNTYPTYRIHGDSLSKERLIPDGVIKAHAFIAKDLLVYDGDAFH